MLNIRRKVTNHRGTILAYFNEAGAGAVAWFLPFMVLFAPAVILQPMEPLLGTIKLIASLVTVLFLQVLLVGYYLTDVDSRGRVISAISVAALVVFVAVGNYLLLAIGLALGILLSFIQLRKRNRLATTEVV